MELYLIRHGIAQEQSPDIPDGDRQLTKKGKDKTERVAQRLQAIGVEFDLILTSPLVRAQQTAQILMDRGLSPHLEIFAPLAPEEDIATGIVQLTQAYQHRSHRCLALVGHQPDLANWAEYLIFGSPQGKLIVKKAGIIGLTLPPWDFQPGQGELFLLISPRWLI
ncbi:MULTISPECIES: phosphohistidine phosphatase SixA [unclassified Synechocystis]|uniref:phosphohistidine phosphatase SixA n=1 Tax=unclassified Synechocystis TaxID=2640012 RepID=UPI000426DE4C|nr:MULTISPECIES: phosphohistidine phosphatase SixA [unclassified Synechocystis]AIE75799.1 Phosphohistidine phosphatase SixA [Synechocystis sp. PCC 6714]MCT0255266.1 phosphohistidine phosphatase SixA [Synechocystis sp. CS-94]